MRPVSPVIKGYEEVVYAKDQPEYLPLPAIRQSDGCVMTRWQMTWRERIRALLTGSIYLEVLTFNRPLQPVRLSFDPPEVESVDEFNPSEIYSRVKQFEAKGAV